MTTAEIKTIAKIIGRTLSSTDRATLLGLLNKATYLTGAVATDGTPTDAEIDSITGTTPGAVDEGTSYLIKDSDALGEAYLVYSDGTSWQYVQLTAAV